MRLGHIFFALTLLISTGAVVADPWLEFRPTDATPQDAPGRGRRVVLVSGDEEYRSEEALPQLAAILSSRHGFHCTVLFSINPDTGAVDADERRNIPGLEALDEADCLVLFTRFRDLPNEQMARIDAYLRAGRPVLGIRTATHAFDLADGSPYARYTWDHAAERSGDDAAWDGGFGRLVLGETWVAHHGAHASQSTRGQVVPDAEDHPIARGLGTASRPLAGPDGIWGPSDVYRVRLPMRDGVEPIVHGVVLEGMTPESPAVDGEQNTPRMPIAWTKAYQIPGGEPGVSVTSTIGASTDLVAEGTRRLLVNAVYWLCGLGEAIPTGGTDARIVGSFRPTQFGFGGSRRGLLPASFSPARPGIRSAGQPGDMDLHDGDRVVLIGGTFAERLAASGYFAALVHAAHPGMTISVRHIPWSADEVGVRPRERGVPTMLERLHDLDPTVVVACYGMSESFGGEPSLDGFERDLADLLTTLAGSPFNGATPPRVALVSPIRHEDLGDPWVFGPVLAERNRVLGRFVDTMRATAERAGVLFCDLYSKTPRASMGRLTTNGIHPTEEGCRLYTRSIGEAIGWLDAGASAPGAAGVSADFRGLAADLYYHERLWYRPTNSEYVFGRRHEPFGSVNFPPEIAQLERMIDARVRALRDAETGGAGALFASPVGAVPVWEAVPTSRDFPEDSWAPPPVLAEGTESSLGDTEIRRPDDFLKSFTLADGYEINAYASEADFPELANPLAIAFDERHRLWVICAQTYPHLMPGEQPRCRIVVLEDSDGDGRADSASVFADRLYIPTGFAIDTDCVYVGQAPDLLRLSDTDGDGVADRREVVCTGFSMPDSHHTISAFEWDPHGGFLMHEGVFGVSGIETPWGTQRAVDAAVWRFDTRTKRLTRLSHSGFANPWGHVFDDYGQSVLADASGGANYSFSQVINGAEGLHKPGRGEAILNRGRPVAGSELIASRHFPDEAQGTYLVNQSIGFHGTRWNRLNPPARDASAWSAEAMPQDLLECSDVNFRPVAMEIGPDGTLFLADWSNPLIGHMQYSVRDPRRDNAHGRIWRIRHAARGTLSPPRIPAGSDAEGRLELLELLRLPERNTRRHARRRLQRADPELVLAEARAWFGGLPDGGPLRGRLALELLWLCRAHGLIDTDLLGQVARMDDPRVRAGAVRVLRHWLAEGTVRDGPALRVLLPAGEDADMRVRLEAVVASGFVGSREASAIAEMASALPADEPLGIAIREAVRFLERHPGGRTDFVRTLELESMPADALAALPPGTIRDRVIAARTEVPLPVRREAAERLVAAGGVGQLARIVLDAGDPDSAAAALAPILFEMPTPEGSESAGQFSALAALPGKAGALGIAMLNRQSGLALGSIPVGDSRLVDLAEILPPGTITIDHVERLLQETRSALHGVSRAVDSLARHTAVSGVRERFVGILMKDWIDPAADTTLAGWDGDSAFAVAGLRGLALASSMTPDAIGPGMGLAIEPASEDQMRLGRRVYLSEANGCVRCHAGDGLGMEGFPPLAASPIVHGSPGRSIAIVLHGLSGELVMPDGSSYNSAMAPLGQLLSDEEAAAVLTYVRQSFGNFATPVSDEQVSMLRASGPPVTGLWRIEDILEIYPLESDSVFPSSQTTPLLATPAAHRSGGASVTRVVAMTALLSGGGCAALMAFLLRLRWISKRPGSS